jgi:Rrf2 family iron-sulfur cluster assembly transcriptional regulator
MEYDDREGIRTKGWLSMRITTKGRYALRAILALAKLGGEDDPVSINTLSDRENISPVFLEQIFFKLRRAGIVSSVRGPGGGFYFARPLGSITIKEILDVAGEDLNLSFCDKHVENCERLGTCLSHPIWANVTELVNDYFRSVTLASILNQQNKEDGDALSSAAGA